MYQELTIFIITVLAFLYGDKNSAWNNGCTTEEHSISCFGVSGRFLPSLGDTPIHNVYIRESDMSHLTMEDFAEYPDVTNIEIQHSYISLPQQNHLFKSLSKLKNLTIENCDVGEEIAATYVTNESLEKLSLRGNRITSISHRLFPNHSRLRELDLSQNGAARIDGNIVEHMKNLQLMDLSGNNLCGPSAGIVALSHKHCEVCRPENVIGRCSLADVTSCTAGLPLDRLWWRSPALQVKLQGNPLCDRVTAHTKDYEGELYVGDWNCKVVNYNCFSHHRRKLFFMEACGMDLPSSEDDSLGNKDTSASGDSEDGSASLEDELNTGEEEITTQENSIANDSGYMFQAGLTKFSLYSVGCIAVGMLLGYMVTSLIKMKLSGTKGTNYRVPQNSDDSNTPVDHSPLLRSGEIRNESYNDTGRLNTSTDGRLTLGNTSDQSLTSEPFNFPNDSRGVVREGMENSNFDRQFKNIENEKKMVEGNI